MISIWLLKKQTIKKQVVKKKLLIDRKVYSLQKSNQIFAKSSNSSHNITRNSKAMLAVFKLLNN